jgi:hypothetical protein
MTSTKIILTTTTAKTSVLTITALGKSSTTIGTTITSGSAISTTKPVTTTKAPTTTSTITPPTDPIVPTFQEFTAAVTKSGYRAPTLDQYKNFANGLRSQGGITTKREAAMFLANIEQESAGLTRIIEDACGPGCAKCPSPAYSTGGDFAGARYCGRGYIQLVKEFLFYRKTPYLVPGATLGSFNLFFQGSTRYQLQPEHFYRFKYPKNHFYGFFFWNSWKTLYRCKKSPRNHK